MLDIHKFVASVRPMQRSQTDCVGFVSDMQRLVLKGVPTTLVQP